MANDQSGYPVRYVATRINSDGMRQLASAMQGRHTYATPEEAQAWIDAIKANNSPDRLADIWGAEPSLEVRPVVCYPGHFDPTTCYFD